VVVNIVVFFFSLRTNPTLFKVFVQRLVYFSEILNKFIVSLHLIHVV